MTVTALSQPTLTAELESGKCGGKTRAGNNCPLKAGQGTDHVGVGRCKHHGGATRSHRQAATRILTEQRITTMFGKDYDTTPITDPLAAFAALAGQVTGWMRTMESLVAELNRPGYASEMAGEQVRAEVQLFERSMDRCERVLGTYAKLNIDERMAAIEAAKAAMVMTALEAGLAAIGVTGARAIDAKKAAAARLRTIEAEPQKAVTDR